MWTCMSSELQDLMGLVSLVYRGIHDTFEYDPLRSWQMLKKLIREQQIRFLCMTETHWCTFRPFGKRKLTCRRRKVVIRFKDKLSFGILTNT